MTTQLLKFFIKACLQEAKIAASPEYMKKEVVRQRIQDDVKKKIASNKITTQLQLDAWFKKQLSTTKNSDELMALNALKMIPIEVYKR